LAGLASMHALERTVGHAGQSTTVIAGMTADGPDEGGSLAADLATDAATSATAPDAASGAEAAELAGLLGCASAGLLCALGVVALIRRAVTGRRPSSQAPSTAPPRGAPLAATQVVQRAAPSVLALSVLRT
jgi:hypothetical protein